MGELIMKDLINWHELSRISENPDKIFTAWTTITELTAEDLEECTYDEAVERVENEVNLKLTNRIDLSNLDLNFVNNED